MTRPATSLTVFAHNEERRLAASLEAADSQATQIDLDIHVMANGCTDRTIDIARSFPARNSRIIVHDIDIGDKANAWNQFIHDVKTPYDYYFFTDGDVRIVQGSFDAMLKDIQTHKDANAVAGLPFSGRTRKAWADHIMKVHGLPGGLYLLPRRSVERFKKAAIRIPRGFIGEDVFLMMMLRRDFEMANPNRREGICVCPTAGFEYDSFSIVSPENILLYWKRLKRNSLRQMQNNILFPKLTKTGNSAIPAHMDEIYTKENIALLRPRNSFPNFLFDRLAIAHIKNTHRMRQ